MPQPSPHTSCAWAEASPTDITRGFALAVRSPAPLHTLFLSRFFPGCTNISVTDAAMSETSVAPRAKRKRSAIACVACHDRYDRSLRDFRASLLRHRLTPVSCFRQES